MKVDNYRMCLYFIMFECPSDCLGCILWKVKISTFYGFTYAFTSRLFILTSVGEYHLFSLVFRRHIKEVLSTVLCIQEWHIEKYRIHFSSEKEQLKCVSKHSTSVKAVATNTQILTTSKVKEWNVNAAINSTLPDKRYLCFTLKNRFNSKLISVN